MTTSQSAKLCKVCNKDVTNAKRVKDPQGRYYCEACHQAAAKPGMASPGASAKAAMPVKAAAPAKAPAPVAMANEYDLSDPEPVKPRPKPAAPAAPAAAPAGRAPAATLPTTCPNCGARVLPNRKLCIKCNRDVTRMDKVLAMRAEAGKVSTEERTAEWISKAVRVGIWLFVIGFIAFSAYGLKLMFFTSTGPFDHYPTSREAAVRDFMGHIAKGGDSSWDNAYKLISMRIQLDTDGGSQFTKHKWAFEKMHNELKSKHGDNWPSKMVLKKESDEDNMDVEYTMKIDDTTYHVLVQAQAPAEDVVYDLREQKMYPEDGQRHFGVSGVEEYPANPRPKPPGGGGDGGGGMGGGIDG